MTNLTTIRFGPLPAFVLITGLFLSNGCSNKPAYSEAQHEQIQRDAMVWIQKGRDAKSESRNREALEHFDAAMRMLEPVYGRNSVDVAAMLDRKATVHMRTGRYAEARKHYLEAVEILSQTEPRNKRLESSVRRRLATLDALEKKHIQCDEPMQPRARNVTDGGPSPRPYEPNFKKVEPVFGKINARLQHCIKGPPLTVTVWIVVANDGRIVRAEVRTRLAGSPEAKCIEQTIESLSPEMAPLFPPFAACFWNFNYPFVIGA